MDDLEVEEMAEKVYELRGAIYSQFKSEAACAEEMGWPRQKLSKITNGYKEPDIEEVVQLANTLGYTIEGMINIFLRRKSPNEQRKKEGT